MPVECARTETTTAVTAGNIGRLKMDSAASLIVVMCERACARAPTRSKREIRLNWVVYVFRCVVNNFVGFHLLMGNANRK